MNSKSNWHHLIRLACSVCIAISLPELWALPITGLYSEEVPVEDRSESELNKADRLALSRVIVKVTGSDKWLDHPTIVNALANASGFVEARSYRTVDVDITLQAQPEAVVDLGLVSSPLPAVVILANVDFSKGLIDEMLTRGNIPIWSSDRPGVLVWIAVQNAQAQRIVLGADSDHPAIDIIQQFARERAVHFLFPILDFQDQNNLSSDDIWALDEDLIRKASARYDPDGILSGRLHITVNGDLVGLWQFIFQEKIDLFDDFETELETYIRMPLDRVTRQLADHFAIARNEQQLPTTVILSVQGIESAESYVQLRNYVRGLSGVTNATLSVIEGDKLELVLVLLGNVQQLKEVIALGRDLVPVPQPTISTSDSSFTYRWTR